MEKDDVHEHLGERQLQFFSRIYCDNRPPNLWHQFERSNQLPLFAIVNNHDCDLVPMTIAFQHLEYMVHL